MTAIANLPEHVIVVGVDGSETSRDALRWAARQAELTDASLQVVMTWFIPIAAYGATMPVSIDMDLDGETRRALDRVILETLGEHNGLDVTRLVVEGHPAPELLKAATTAELLVVGSRGHGAFTGMLLGSVSEHCVAHSPCPVVVVRHTQDPA